MTDKEFNAAAIFIGNFIHPMQRQVMTESALGEEGEWFKSKFVELAQTIASMPVTYEQDGKGNDAVAYLHYFHPAGWDWYITEKDMEDGVSQAFGLVYGHECELGYISITEIVNAGAELDLNFQPATLREIKAAKAAA